RGLPCRASTPDPLDFRRRVVALNQEVAGFKHAVVGVAYAVLLAFVVVSVWEDFDKTHQDIHAEAGGS
ncbi:MAG: hypothetical protein WBV18_07930, partial [Methyloceanibacter sp.]|uniref:bestrophin-like domain n=1 Tax=Methyloceanibacter sp. TaxID=1965321 RepID=UPI003C603C30